MPKNAGITAKQLTFVNADVSDKAICYTELSGLPLTALRGIEAWRASYFKVSDNSPLHTHIDVTQFSHVIAPSAQELNILEEDFKYFLLAVMTGVLTRSTQDTISAGLYEFTFSRGDTRRIGNERTIRQNGLSKYYRVAIIERVKELLGNADSHCLASLSALASYYETQVYTPTLFINENGERVLRKSFACTIAKELSYDLRNRAKNKGLSEVQIEEITEKLLESKNLNEWAKPIPESDEDAYEWEIGEQDADGEPRLKYTINPEVLKDGYASAVFQSDRKSVV